MKGAYLHPLSIRIWHWVNAVIVLVLVATGIELRVTGLGIFPDYSFAVALHVYAGYLLACSFLFWLTTYVVTGRLAGNYFLSLDDAKTIPAQVAYYTYHFFRGRPNPFQPSQERRFNALQKIAYSFIMFIAMPLIIITGILSGNIMDFYGLISLAGGVRVIDAVHVITGYIFVIYLIVHLYMATLGKKLTSHTKAMITGYEDE